MHWYTVIFLSCIISLTLGTYSGVSSQMLGPHTLIPIDPLNLINQLNPLNPTSPFYGLPSQPAQAEAMPPAPWENKNLHMRHQRDWSVVLGLILLIAVTAGLWLIVTRR